jgi:hypothetical protein
MGIEELSIVRLTTDEWEKAQASIMLFWDTTPSLRILAFLRKSLEIAF